MRISVIIPTHNRLEKLRATVERLRMQEFPATDYEIIVVDDGSSPPVSLAEDFTVSPTLSVIRLEGVERSIARNTGARAARGEFLVFVDDDIETKSDFLNVFWQAHLDFPGALIVGAVRLPPELLNVPFVNFRQHLEDNGIPPKRGVINDKNFCTAQNMGIRRERFLELGGFDEEIVSSEDQDFALRHTAIGGQIAFLPEAQVIHRDGALDIRSYCRRNEWGSRLMRPFYERYPDMPANIERERINGAAKFGEDSPFMLARKALKAVIASPLAVKPLFLVADALESISPQSPLLDKTYRLLLGAHIFRGYRAAKRNEAK